MLGRRPRLPEDRWRWLIGNHPILASLSPEEAAELRRLTEMFLRRVSLEGRDGCDLTADMSAVIAVQACLPILRLGMRWYRGWKSVVVVPRAFREEQWSVDRAGVIHEWTESEEGVAWERGPVVLGWDGVEDSGWGTGYNVVIHEAAHKLDMGDGVVDGRPPLHRDMDPRVWQEVCADAYTAMKANRAGRGIDRYALESDAEFFAVLSETFFERPRFLRRALPAVYGLYANFYRQDPATRTVRR